MKGVKCLRIKKFEKENLKSKKEKMKNLNKLIISKKIDWIDWNVFPNTIESITLESPNTDYPLNEYFTKLSDLSLIWDNTKPKTNFTTVKTLKVKSNFSNFRLFYFKGKINFKLG
jgi:hypothetical protein